VTGEGVIIVPLGKVPGMGMTGIVANDLLLVRAMAHTFDKGFNKRSRD